jgi:hypothetical protein
MASLKRAMELLSALYGVGLQRMISKEFSGHPTATPELLWERKERQGFASFAYIKIIPLTI